MSLLLIRSVPQSSIIQCLSSIQEDFNTPVQTLQIIYFNESAHQRHQLIPPVPAIGHPDQCVPLLGEFLSGSPQLPVWCNVRPIRCKCFQVNPLAPSWSTSSPLAAFWHIPSGFASPYLSVQATNVQSNFSLSLSAAWRSDYIYPLYA